MERSRCVFTHCFPPMQLYLSTDPNSVQYLIDYMTLPDGQMTVNMYCNLRDNSTPLDGYVS